MAPPTGPPASLSRKVQKRRAEVNDDQPSSSLSDQKKKNKNDFFLYYIKQILHFDINTHILSLGFYPPSVTLNFPGFILL